MLSNKDDEIYQSAIVTMRKQNGNCFVYNVYVYDTFVSFCSGDDKSTVIYSEEDKWPSYVSYPGEDRRKRAKTIAKITDHWYKAYYDYL